MSPQEKKEFQEAVALGVSEGFKKAPKRKSNPFPTTAAGWVGFIVATVAALGLIWAGFQKLNSFSKVAEIAEDGILPVAKRRIDNHDILIAELKLQNAQIPLLGRRLELAEANIKLFSAHLAQEGIHQTPAQKELTTVKNLQPIRDDIGKLDHRMEKLEESLQELVEQGK